MKRNVRCCAGSCGGRGAAVFRQLEPTRIGLEACGGAHYWARELKGLGHDAVLMPPQLITPYVQRNKNDGRDAEAGCEAMSRPRIDSCRSRAPNSRRRRCCSAYATG